MNLLTKEQFVGTKKHKTLAVLGCGYSINNINSNVWEFIKNECDSFALNWFCLGYVPIIPKYYLVDEQGSNKKAVGNVTADNFINNLKCEIAIVKDRSNACDKYRHKENLDKLKCDGIIVRSLPKTKTVVGCDRFDIVDDGMVYVNGCLSNTVHFALWMKYDRVIYFGVDLYDSRYYWMPYDQEWEVVKNSGMTIDSRHGQADNFINMLKEAKENYPHINWVVFNSKSLLAEVLPVWNLSV